MVIFFLFVLAMLAGWGLDELTEPAAGLAVAQARGARRRGGHLLRAVRLDARRRHARPGPAQAGAQRWPGGSPTIGRRIRWRQRAPRRSATIRLSALLQWLAAGGRRAALIARSPARHPACGCVAAAGRRLRRAGGGDPGGRPVPREHGLQHRRSRSTTPSSRPRGPSATCSRVARTASPGWTRRATSSRCRPTWRCATGSTTRAGYDYPVVERYDTLVAGDGRAARVLQHPDAEAMATPEAVRGMSLLSVADVIQDPTDPPGPAARPRARLLGAGRARVPERQRSAACLPGRSPAGRRRRRRGARGDQGPRLRRRAGWR